MAANHLFRRPQVRLRRPRLFGVVMIACGLVLNVMNWHEVTTTGRYWVLSLAMGPAAILFGMWRLAVGQPWNEAANRMERWATAGDLITVGVGLAISAFLFYQINFA